jgi:hypothetical protein
VGEGLRVAWCSNVKIHRQFRRRCVYRWAYDVPENRAVDRHRYFDGSKCAFEFGTVFFGEV